MTLVRTIEALRQRWSLLVRMFIVLLVLLVLIDAVPFLIDKEKAHTAMESIPGFWSLFGFFSCVLIVYISKYLGKIGLLQREDFYHD
ncbi:hypothetical protein A7E78_10505 [Syntrophotalea acetylenivorans]|uniref:Uncharacterized protein n=1 Tax=Syntrophotalea acetylenivorans TaxID=1842532 RepID=A0A1L3GQL9_9BACT|nr:hypothetical protein [Syntrophotalea acetylenivorans]APG28239.1 hypothetical protein A7E78_10505 [Syntrophotalea acetylenivorans]